MPASLIPSFLIYCYIGAITPGPANLCSLGAGLRYGSKLALKQWRGLLVGFTIDAMAAVLVTWLLGALLNDYVGYLAWVGAAYLLYLAWHMLRSAGSLQTEKDPAYPSFRNGLLLQLTNVKVIVCCLTALSSYVLPYNSSLTALLAAGLVLPFTGPVANLLWLYAGASLQRLFARHRKVVDVVLAVSLALCAVSLVWPH